MSTAHFDKLQAMVAVQRVTIEAIIRLDKDLRVLLDAMRNAALTPRATGELTKIKDLLDGFLMQYLRESRIAVARQSANVPAEEIKEAGKKMLAAEEIPVESSLDIIKEFVDKYIHDKS